jgi:uncharacterized membrane protein YfhO
MAFLGSQKNIYIIGSAGLCIFYLIAIDFFLGKKNQQPLSMNKNFRVFLNLTFFFIAVTLELLLSSHIAVKTNTTNPRNAYPDRYNEARELINLSRPSGNDFFRTEFSQWFSINDPSLYYYNGISLFSSLANVNVTNFMRGLGLPANGLDNRYSYYETSPLTNAVLNLRYMIGRGGFPVDNNKHWETVAGSGRSNLLENLYYLPLGFMVNEELITYTHNRKNPFLSQNNFFNLATGLDGNLFTIKDISSDMYIEKNSSGVEILKWDFEMPKDAMLYAYAFIGNIDRLNIVLYGQRQNVVNIALPYIFPAGNFPGGTVVSFTTDKKTIRGAPVFYAACLDSELFSRGYELLAGQTLKLKEFSGTKIAGLVTAKKDGLLYTSIPNDGNWTAWVDGEESEILDIDGAMAALRLGEGEHSIEFRYYNSKLTLGILISIVSFAIFIALVLLDTCRKRMKKNESRKKE